MKLNLKKPLVIFDLETTGLDLVKDRIIQLSYIKVYPDGHEERVNELVNPEKIIPAEVQALTGITNEMVKDKPTFKQIAARLDKEFTGCDFAGFNSNHFDIPLLGEEFLRAGVQFDLTKRSMIDVFTIFTRKEQRTLSAAYSFYCGKELTDAHSADADTMATYEVLMAQAERYPDLPKDVEGLAQYSAPSQHYADLAGKLSYNDKGEVVFAFGKYKDVPVSEVLVRDSGYYGWIMQGDFPQYTKNVIANIKLQQRLAAKGI